MAHRNRSQTVPSSPVNVNFVVLVVVQLLLPAVEVKPTRTRRKVANEPLIASISSQRYHPPEGVVQLPEACPECQQTADEHHQRAQRGKSNRVVENRGTEVEEHLPDRGLLAGKPGHRPLDGHEAKAGEKTGPHERHQPQMLPAVVDSVGELLQLGSGRN